MTTYVATNPVTLSCGQCGAGVGQACRMSRGNLAKSHIERILAAATKDVAAKKKLGTSAHYSQEWERGLKRLMGASLESRGADLSEAGGVHPGIPQGQL
jgi:hypothetical protein